MAYEALSGSNPAKIKHVVLMTDGVSVPGPFYELTTKMAGDQITVSTVGVGSDADQNLLQQMAEWGNGRFYFTDNPQNIPQIFARETMTASKSSLQETPFQAKVVRPADFLSGCSAGDRALSARPGAGQDEADGGTYGSCPTGAIRCSRHGVTAWDRRRRLLPMRAIAGRSSGCAGKASANSGCN